MRTKALKHVFAVGLAAMVALGVTGVASTKTRARDYVGVWQLDDRNGNGWNQEINGGWNDRSGRSDDWGDSRRGNYDDRYDSRNGSRGGLRLARLPESFRIERDRGDLRLEGMNGQLLREIDFQRDRQLVSQRTMFGTTIYETYSLTKNGRRLMVHTTIRGSQGTREMTSVYERA